MPSSEGKLVKQRVKKNFLPLHPWEGFRFVSVTQKIASTKKAILSIRPDLMTSHITVRWVGVGIPKALGAHRARQIELLRSTSPLSLQINHLHYAPLSIPSSSTHSPVCNQRRKVPAKHTMTRASFFKAHCRQCHSFRADLLQTMPKKCRSRPSLPRPRQLGRLHHRVNHLPRSLFKKTRCKAHLLSYKTLLGSIIVPQKLTKQMMREP